MSKEVITFTDASTEAYGCTVYVRCEYDNHEVTCRLVASKSKVAPLTPITVPKLELMGAVLGLRLAQSVIAVLGIPIHDVYTSIQIVLMYFGGYVVEVKSSADLS